MQTTESLALTLQQKSRIELIEDIRSIAHPQTFHQILKWPTEALRLYILEDLSHKNDSRTDDN